MNSISRLIFTCGAILFCALNAQASAIQWNGFGSFYYGQALNEGFLPYPSFTDTHAQFTNFSLIGLNLSSQLTPDLAATAQIVGLGQPINRSDSFGLIAQWAFLRYQPVNGVNLKLGRQLFPAFLGSEFIRVGYLLPFRSYSGPFILNPFSRFDGASGSHTVDIGIGDFTYGVFVGTPLLDISIADTSTYTVGDLFGAYVMLAGNGWTVRAFGSQFSVKTNFGNCATLPGGCEGHSQDFTLGVRYDKNNIVFWGESSLNQTPDGTPMNGGRYGGPTLIHSLFGGYRIGNLMPRYKITQVSAVYHQIPGFVGSNTQHIIGMNYQAGSQAILKFEFEYNLIPSIPGGVLATQPTGKSFTTGSAFYAGVDFIF